MEPITCWILMIVLFIVPSNVLEPEFFRLRLAVLIEGVEELVKH